ncbi:MAG: tRNA (adenosine(37)-N6)-threonylcarbamoyltransferase complex ATPase subunit type 1 TsaE [Vicingaceae bacterium]
MELRSKQLEDLPEVAQEIVELTKSNKVLTFSGSMGAGKTTLITAICKILGVEDAISSPTYSLVNEYLDADGQSIYHFDFYRIEDEEEALDMGVEEYFYSGNLCLIEWPEKIEGLLPENCLQIKINLEKSERIFNLEVP